MQKLHNTQSKHTPFSLDYQVLLPLNVAVLIPENDPVRLLRDFMDKLDYTLLKESYSDIDRKPSVCPITMLKILVYSYMNNIYSSRKIESACRRDINFIWLLQGQAPPEHSSIARFRSKHLLGYIETIFYQSVEYLHSIEEIPFKNIFIDGTKIEANANRYSFVWKKSTERYEASLRIKISTLFKQINATFQTAFTLQESENPLPSLRIAYQYLCIVGQQNSIAFVSGRGHRKTFLQRAVETLADFIRRQEKYNKYNKILGGRNSFSKTDTDATFMRMKEDHMLNGQLKPGYNVQIGVEAEYIVGMDIFSERNDVNTLVPFMNKVQSELGGTFENVVADVGYESEENYEYLESSKSISYIKPQNYEKMKQRKFKKSIGRAENMIYDESMDEYTCKNGRKLRACATQMRKSIVGYSSDVTVYECEDCRDCQYRLDCTKAKPENNKRIYISKKFQAYRKESLMNIQTKEGIMLRMNRSIQVEGASGIIKQDHAFRRFLMRGKNKVKVEFLLLSLAFNVNKLHKKRQRDKVHEYLYKIDIAA